MERRGPRGGSLLACSAAALLLIACGHAPPYTPPAVELPAAWQAEAPWRSATPRDDERKGAWWAVFGDNTLDALQQQALARNQNLAAARARLQQARALAQAAGASLYPRIDAGARSGRQQPAENRATYNDSPGAATPQNEYALTLSVSYELDLFGRVASEVGMADASAQQAGAELENTLLLLNADLATLYFNLRATDAELEVLRQGIAVQSRALGLLEARRRGGAASGLDMAQQQSLLDATRTQFELLRRTRLQYEHALATLVGAPAGVFTLAPIAEGLAGLPPAPALPLLLPSDLLERRPDVAAAERAVAVANAQIGVSQAAAFPSVVLGAGGGLQSRALDTLFQANSVLWSFGSSLAVSVFDAGRNDARLQASRAAHDAAVAGYRQSVLRAVQEVEDGLGGLQVLAQAAERAESAVVSAQRVLDIATARYQGGATTYLDVVTAQQTVLNNRRLATQLLGQQLATTVFLAKALGGGFDGRQPYMGKVWRLEFIESARLHSRPSLSEILCARHSMTPRSIYAEQEDDEGGGGRIGGDAVHPQGTH